MRFDNFFGFPICVMSLRISPKGLLAYPKRLFTSKAFNPFPDVKSFSFHSQFWQDTFNLKANLCRFWLFFMGVMVN